MNGASRRVSVVSTSVQRVVGGALVAVRSLFQKRRRLRRTYQFERLVDERLDRARRRACES